MFSVEGSEFGSASVDGFEPEIFGKAAKFSLVFPATVTAKQLLVGFFSGPFGGSHRKLRACMVWGSHFTPFEH